MLVRDPDNAATELIEEGVNGFVADDAEPEELAAAIVRVHEAGAGAARLDRGVVRAATRARLSLDALARRGRRELRASARS